jgi:hypothetical protein
MSVLYIVMEQPDTASSPWRSISRLTSLWRLFLLEKLKAIHPVKKYPTMFTGVHIWSPCWATWIESRLSRPSSPGSVLLISVHLCLVLPSGLAHSDFVATILYAIICLSLARDMTHLHHHSWFHYCNNILWKCKIYSSYFPWTVQVHIWNLVVWILMDKRVHGVPYKATRLYRPLS